MPILPSGLIIGIGYQAIPESVGPNWFKCPEGHFWYKRPDVSISPPPYDGTTQILEDWVHAPVPATVEEVKQYMYVLHRKPNGKWQWQGEWLSEFPKPGQFDPADENAWNDWITSERQCRFYKKQLKSVVIRLNLTRTAWVSQYLRTSTHDAGVCGFDHLCLFGPIPCRALAIHFTISKLENTGFVHDLPPAAAPILGRKLIGMSLGNPPSSQCDRCPSIDSQLTGSIS